MLYKTGKPGKSKLETEKIPLNGISDYYWYLYLFQTRGKNLFLLKDIYWAEKQFNSEILIV